MTKHAGAKRSRKTLGGRIAIARKAARLTQQEIANHLGVCLGTVQRYEADDIAPSVEIVKKIARRVRSKVGWIAAAEGAGP